MAVLPPAFVAAHVSAHADPAHPVGVVGLTRDVHDEAPYARAYGRGSIIARAAHHKRLFRQSGQRRGVRADVAGHFRAFIHFAKIALVNA